MDKNLGILDIHGKADVFVNYYEEWDWKEGEFINVGTMKDVPSNVEYWAEKHNCLDLGTTQAPQYEHIVHRDEFGFQHFLKNCQVPCQNHATEWSIG